MGLDIVGYTNHFADLETALVKKNKSTVKEACSSLAGVTKDHFTQTDFAVSKKTFSELLKLYKKDIPKDQLPTIFTLIEKKYKNDK